MDDMSFVSFLKNQYESTFDESDQMLSVIDQTAHAEFESFQKLGDEWSMRAICDYRENFINDSLLPIFRVFIISCKELCSSEANSPSNTKITSVLLSILNQALEVASEVIALLGFGLISGAEARARNLLEQRIISEFISIYGDDCAERYQQHWICDEHRLIEKQASSPNETPPDDDYIVTLCAEIIRLKNKFGEDYLNPYGWASSFLNKPKPRFSDFIEKLDRSSWEFHYKLQSKQVHPELNEHPFHTQKNANLSRLSQRIPCPIDSLIDGCRLNIMTIVGLLLKNDMNQFESKNLLAYLYSIYKLEKEILKTSNQG
ncbi:MAG: DUF5677 domain-containing protein [Neptuniibacter sp.]